MDVDLKSHRLTIKVGMKYKAYRIITVVQTSIIEWIFAFFALYTVVVKLQLSIVSGLNGELGGSAQRLVETEALSKGLESRHG